MVEEDQGSSGSKNTPTKGEWTMATDVPAIYDNILQWTSQWGGVHGVGLIGTHPEGWCQHPWRRPVMAEINPGRATNIQSQLW